MSDKAQLGKKKNIDMTKGDPYRLLISFAMPLLLGDLFQQLYNMTDTWVIGNYATNDEYAAVGSCFPVLLLVIKSFVGLSSGVGIVIARKFGAGDREGVRKSSYTAICIALACCVIFTVLGKVAGPIALRISKVPENVVGHARAYLDIIFNLVSAQIIYNMGAGILRAVGDSRKPFIFLVIASVTNIVLDLYFVVVLGKGIRGVAWATAIAQCIAAVLIIIELFRTDTDVRIIKKHFGFDKTICKDMIKLGIPTAIQIAVTAISNVFVQSYVNKLGVNFMGGNATYVKCEQILFLAATSMGLASMTYVSQNVGAKDYQRARDGVRASNVMMITYTFVIGSLMMIFAPKIAGFFNSNPEVIDNSVFCLRMITPAFFFMGISQVLMGALRGCGDTKTPLYIQIGFNILFRQIALFLITTYIAHTRFTVVIVQPSSWIIMFLATSFAYSRCLIGKKDKQNII